MIVTNLYDALGLPRGTSDRAAIRRAFRSKANKTHPDKGGNADEFSLIATAYRVLNDDEDRAAYDATGKIDERSKVQDEKLRDALSVVGIAFEQIASTRNILQIDLPAEVVRLVKGRRDRVSSAISEMEADIKSSEKALKRIGRKKLDAEDYLSLLINSRIEKLKHPLGIAKNELEAIDRALVILDLGYTYKMDAPTADQATLAELLKSASFRGPFQFGP